MEGRILDKYSISAQKVRADIEIMSTPKDFVPIYNVRMPKLEKATLVLLEEIKDTLVSLMRIKVSELMDPRSFEELKKKFYSKSLELIEKQLPGLPPEKKQLLAGMLLHEMLGLGQLEMLLADGNLEEIVVNSSKEPVWVYHKKHGWLKTNIIVPNEAQIHNYAASIGRKVGRQITTLDPLLDAHLISGDRVNATLFPVSTTGNTLTIRMFRRKPWTITDFIENKTVTSDVAALIWLAVQYEMSMIISGGTASGKCVSGDTKIILSNGERKKIVDIVNEAFIKYNPKRMQDGWLISDCDLKVLTLNGDLKIEPKKVTHVWKRKAPEFLYEIKASNGEKIRVTGEHPFFSIKNGKTFKIRADHLKNGQFIALPRKLTFIQEEINFRDMIVNNLEVGYVDSVIIPRKIKIDGCLHRISQWRTGRKKVPIKVAREFKDDITYVYSRYGKKIKIPRKVSPELMALIGYIIGDGHLTKNNVEFHNSNEKLLNKVNSLFKSVFEVQGKIKKYKNKTPKLIVHSTVLCNIFNKVFGIPIGKKSRSVRTVSWIFGLKNRMISALLRGLFDCDSYVSEKTEIEFTSASRQLILDTILLLKRFGIFCRYGRKIVSGKTSFRLFFSDKNQLTLFKENVGYNHPKKKKDLIRILNKGSYHSNIDLIPETSNLFKSLKQKLNLYDREIAERCDLSRRGFGRIRNGDRNPTRQTLKKIVFGLESLIKNELAGKDGSGLNEIEFLKKLAFSDVFWGRIVSVKKIKCKDKWVYDLTVDNTHNFIAGESGGFIIHNTSFLGSIMPFIQPNQRIISIEDTRELNLPKFLHWIPLTTREPNPEGRGEITMLDLLVNSLRMRPDRVIVAEIRRQRQAEVLFEAMHTGHSVYATLHADTVDQTYRRLINPPINVPETLLEALDLIVAMFRDRRTGIRRIYQVAELIPPAGAKKGMTIRVLFKWNPRKDTIERFQKSYRLMNKLQMHTGMTSTEIEKDIQDKERILNWMTKNHVNTVDGVGKVVAEYYRDPKKVLDIVKKNWKAEKLIPKQLLEG